MQKYLPQEVQIAKKVTIHNNTAKHSLLMTNFHLHFLLRSSVTMSNNTYDTA